MAPPVSEPAVHASLWEQAAPYAAEFFGAFVLTTTFLCNYAASSDPVWAATSNGFMVAAMVSACLHVSGGNLNPCIAGAACAAAVRYGVSNVTVDIGPHERFSWFEVGVVEVVYSSMICFVYLNCAASTKNNPSGDQNGFVGLAVGLCCVAGGYAAREVSRTVMNSAIAVGLGIVDQSDGFSAGCLAYLFYDTVGALLGVGAYRVVRPQEFKASGPTDLREERVQEESARILAEFIGSFYVIFTKAMNHMSGMRLAGPEAWSVAAALSSMAYALRGVSGGYFNPAVTLSAVLSGRGVCTRRAAIFYMIVQVLAAVAASSMFAIVNHGVEMDIKARHVLSPATAAAETLFMCVTCYTVLATSVATPTASKTKQNNIAGWAYGACVTVGGFAIGNISGSMLNPAVALAFSGLSALDRDLRSTCLPYVFYHVAGALLAAALFSVTHARHLRAKPGAAASGHRSSQLP